ELRLRPARGAPRPAPQCGAELRGDGHGAGHRARPRRLHPRRPGHHRSRRRRPRPGHRRRLPEGEPDARRHRPRRAPARARGPGRRPRGVHLQGGGLPRRARAASRVLRPAGQEPAARHLPGHPGGSRGHRGDPQLPHAGVSGGRAHDDRSRHRRGARPGGGHPEDPVGDAGHQAHDGRPGRPARRRLGAAGGQHHPALPLRPPPRGRGDEAGRSDRLVHPLALRDRGHPGRGLRRDPRRPPAGRLEGRAARSAAGRVPAAGRRADHELRSPDGRPAHRRGVGLGAGLGPVAAPLPARL
ncbi:MAG: Assymetric_cell_division_FstX, partial [uncultured Solirubrobacteraceae bacterium]